ncbi:hypothetical protein HY797_01140 [Candidatus Falkowbacteria bacterium]|nr:hypothetical protein [Candidatus Falkowbacteria bacterium]
MSKLMPKNKKIEIFIQATAYSLIVIGLVLILGRKSWWPSYYSPIYFGLSFLASAWLIIISRYIFKPPDLRRQESIIFLRFAIALVLAFNALGELYFYQLYKYGIQYDKLIHFIDSFLFVAVLTSFYEKWHNFKMGRALKTAIIIVVLAGLLWEIFEFSSDFFFKTKEFGVYGQFKTIDTIFDILSDFLGVTVGSIFISWRGWGNLFNKLAGYNLQMASTKILASGGCSPHLTIK